MNTAATMTAQTKRPGRVILKFLQYQKDGALKREYEVTDRTFILYGVIALLVWVFAPAAADGMDSWVKQQQIDELRPKMELLANQGKDEAALWMAKHFYDDNKDRITTLAAKGHPEAMYVEGRVLIRNGNKEEGHRWVKKAAEAGWAAAIGYLDHEKKS